MDDVTPRPEPARSRRVGLYAGASSDSLSPIHVERLDKLRAYARLRGWAVVAECGYGTAAGGTTDWSSFMIRASPPSELDLIVVWRLDNTFASVQQAVEDLELLFEWRVDFRSHSEPWIDSTITSRQAVLRIAQSWARLDGRRGESGEGLLKPELNLLLTQYLQQRDDEFVGRQREQAAQKQRDAQGRQVAQTVTYLILLTAYASVLAAVSSQRLLGELLLPSTIAGHVWGIGRNVGDVASGIPDLLQKLLVPVVASAALLLFRSTSKRARAGLGGIAFGFVLSVALLGLATAAISGVLGLLAALPGALAAIVVLCEFSAALTRIDSREESPPAPKAMGWHSVLASMEPRWRWVCGRIHPGNTAALASVYLTLPLISAGLLAVAVMVGPILHVGRLALAGLGIWAAWAAISMPGVLRGPVCSLLATSLALTAVLAFGALATVFATEVALITVLSVGYLTVRPQR